MSSYFSAALTELLQSRSQREIAELAGLSQPTLSLYASGDRGIGVKQLAELAKAFPNRADYLNLVRAHLLDEMPAEVFNELAIVTNGHRVEEAQSGYDKSLDSMIEMLRVKAKNPEVRALLEDLARILK